MMRHALLILVALVAVLGIVAPGGAAISFPTNGDKVVFTGPSGTRTKLTHSFLMNIPSGSPPSGGAGFVNCGATWIFTDTANSTKLRIYAADGTVDITGDCDFSSFFGIDTVITVVWDGSQSTSATRLVLYLNGVAQTLSFGAGSVFTTHPFGSGLPVSLGDFDPNGVRPLLSEFAVWNNVALTATEVASLAATKGNALRADLKPSAYVEMLSVGTVHDAMGYLGAATVTGSSTVAHPRTFK